MINYNIEIENLIEKLFHKLVAYDKTGIKTGYKNDKLSILDLIVLIEIGKSEKISVLDLLNKINVDRGKVSTSLNNFINLKYVHKERCISDKRKFKLTLTKEGTKIYDKFNHRDKEIFEFLLNDMTINEQKTILKFLSKLNQLTVDKFDI